MTDRGWLICAVMIFVAAAWVIATPAARRPDQRRPDQRRPDQYGPEAQRSRWPSSVPTSVPAAVVADVVAALLAAGLSPDLALRIVRRAMDDLGLSAPVGLGPLLEALTLSASTGIAPVALVRAAADEQRRIDAAAKSHAAQRLSVLIVLPMGLCLLPAFVVLTVAPMVLSLLTG